MRSNGSKKIAPATVAARRGSNLARFVKKVLPILILTIPALPACADSIDLVITGSIGSTAGEASNGFYMATYPDSSQLQVFGPPQTGNNFAQLVFPTFTLPAGAVVTNATLDVSFVPLIQEGPFSDTTYLQGPGPANINNPYHVPGQINETISTQTSFYSIGGHSYSSNATCQLNAPGNSVDLVQAGFSPCLSGTLGYYVDFSSLTTLTPSLVSAGYNSWEIFAFEGGNSTDLTADLSINYDVPGGPTPEPSSFVLLATGIAALIGVVRQRRSISC
jgi:hypothetical protein